MCAVQAAAVNTNTPIIVVLIHGGPLDVAWMEKSDRINGILSAWYPGQVLSAIFMHVTQLVIRLFVCLSFHLFVCQPSPLK